MQPKFFSIYQQIRVYGFELDSNVNRLQDSIHWRYYFKACSNIFPEKLFEGRKGILDSMPSIITGKIRPYYIPKTTRKKWVLGKEFKLFSQLGDASNEREYFEIARDILIVLAREQMLISWQNLKEFMEKQKLKTPKPKDSKWYVERDKPSNVSNSSSISQ